jgi:hypothetical protein
MPLIGHHDQMPKITVLIKRAINLRMKTTAPAIQRISRLYRIQAATRAINRATKRTAIAMPFNGGLYKSQAAAAEIPLR